MEIQGLVNTRMTEPAEFCLWSLRALLVNGSTTSIVDTVSMRRGNAWVSCWALKSWRCGCSGPDETSPLFGPQQWHPRVLARVWSGKPANQPYTVQQIHNLRYIRLVDKDLFFVETRSLEELGRAWKSVSLCPTYPSKPSQCHACMDAGRFPEENTGKKSSVQRQETSRGPLVRNTDPKEDKPPAQNSRFIAAKTWWKQVLRTNF